MSAASGFFGIITPKRFAFRLSDKLGLFDLDGLLSMIGSGITNCFGNSGGNLMEFDTTGSIIFGEKKGDFLFSDGENLNIDGLAECNLLGRLICFDIELDGN